MKDRVLKHYEYIKYLALATLKKKEIDIYSSSFLRHFAKANPSQFLQSLTSHHGFHRDHRPDIPQHKHPESLFLERKNHHW
jgi:hypothetical protein